MLPPHQTSIAELPSDLSHAIHRVAREAERLWQRGNGNFAASTMFSWFENGELLTCRVMLESDTAVTVTPLLVTVSVQVTDEHGERNIFRAPAFSRAWQAIEQRWHCFFQMNDRDDAMFVIPLEALLAR